MDFKQITDRIKALVGQRGGTQSVKEDASEVHDVYSGQGSTEDKLKGSAEAIREPGAPQADPGTGSPGAEGPPPGTEQTP